MKKGFTLIELLVVIAIIAILVAALFPAFEHMRAVIREKKLRNLEDNSITNTINTTCLEKSEKTPEQIEEEYRIKEKIRIGREALRKAMKLEEERKLYQVKRAFEVDGYTIYEVYYGGFHFIAIPKPIESTNCMCAGNR